MSQEKELKSVEDALIGLASVEEELEKAERKAEISRLKSVQSIYSSRRKFVQGLDRFWHIVLAQHPEFSEYIRSQDFKYLELIKDIYVEWDVASGDASDVNPEDFSVTFIFGSLGDDFPEQVITKKFKLEKLDPEQQASLNPGSDGDDEEEPLTERLISEPVDIIWPHEYLSINPSNIKDKKTAEGKKNYRAGMKSFFGWFRWTGKKPRKEFPSGDDFARLFADDIFPNAVKYYTEAQRDGLEEESDSDASEPLDLSDEETPKGVKRKHEED